MREGKGVNRQKAENRREHLLNKQVFLQVCSFLEVYAVLPTNGD